MADPILKSSLKTKLNTMCCDIFALLILKVDNFQLCLKTATPGSAISTGENLKVVWAEF